MKCSFCLTGKYHFCRGNIPIGVKRDGGFARYCKVPLAQVHILPPFVSLQQGRVLPTYFFFHWISHSVLQYSEDIYDFLANFLNELLKKGVKN